MYLHTNAFAEYMQRLLSVPCYMWQYLLLIMIVKAKYFLYCSLNQGVVLGERDNVRLLCRARR